MNPAPSPSSPAPRDDLPSQAARVVIANTSLAQTEALLRAVVESTPDAIFVKDHEGRYLLFNEAASRFVGRPIAEVLGKDDRTLFDEQSARLIQERDRRVLRLGITETQEEELTCAGVTRTYLATKSPYRNAEGQVLGVLGISRDISDLKRWQRLVAGQNSVLTLIAGGASLEHSLDTLLRCIEAESSGLFCSILLTDASGTRLRHGAAPRLPASYNQAVDGLVIGPDAGSCGTAAHRGQPVFVEDIATDPLWNRFRHLALPLGFRSCWSTPILDADLRVLGTFAIYTRETKLPDAEQRRLIELATATAAIAINRDRSDNLIRERKEQFRLFVQHAPVAIAMLDTQMRYVTASQRWHLDYGLVGQELRGRSHYDVFPEVPEVWREIHRRCLAGAVEHGEMDPSDRADGSRQWIRWAIHPWYTTTGTIGGLMIFSEDITARHRTERHRATEHAVMRVLAEARSLGEATPAVLEAIARAEGYGYGTLWQIEPLEGKLRCTASWHIAEREYPELDSESHALALDRGQGLPGRVWDTGRVTLVPDVEVDPGFLRKKGAAAAGFRSAVGIPIRAGGQVTGVLDFFSTAPMEPNAEFEETLNLLGSQVGQFIERTGSREELQRFVALSPAVLYALRVTPRGLKCFWASENLEAMTGYQMDHSVHGAWWVDHIHPDDRERVLAANHLPYTVEHQVLEFRFRHREGHYLWLRDEKRLLRDAQGQPTEVIGAWLDITERMRLEVQLRQAQKMEALGLLSGGIAHDFNNILGAIIGETELAALDLDPGHPASESLRQIVKASRRATSLIRQILAFARQEPVELHPVDLRHVVKESVRLLRATIPTGIELICDVAPQPCVALAGETQIQQAILNLGTNAWHALEGRSGSIRFELAPLELASDFTDQHHDLRPGRYLRLRVSDTGKGMEPTVLERIFDPFFTTKAPGQGTGLGLSVVHGIIREHRGAILVASTPGQGTTFDLYLPVFTETPASPAMRAPPLQVGQGELILVVDDETALGKTIARALERFGYRVSLHHQAAEALAAFHAAPETFHLVISDLNMPAVSGLEVARAILAVRPQLPILLASGLVTDLAAKEMEALGIRGVLRKPVTLTELNVVVRDALNKANGVSPSL